VREILAAGGYTTVNTLGSGFNIAQGLAVDGSGNLYVADSYNSAVKEMVFSTPPSPSFAQTNLGSTSADSPRSVTVWNNGNQPLSFPVPTTAGAYNPSVSANFTYDNSSTCLQSASGAASAFTLAAGVSCTVAVDFAPMVDGSPGGSVTLTDNSWNAPAPACTTQSIGLSGTGTGLLQPVAGIIAPTTLTYGAPLGLSATATYNGSAVQGSFAYTATPANGAASTVTATVLAAGSYTLTATFTPSTTGTYATATATNSLIVNKATPTITLSPSANSAVVGSAVTLTATVSSAAGTPTGTVTLLNGATTLGTATLAGISPIQHSRSALTIGCSVDKSVVPISCPMEQTRERWNHWRRWIGRRLGVTQSASDCQPNI
jgi:hypothetical protein